MGALKYEQMPLSSVLDEINLGVFDIIEWLNTPNTLEMFDNYGPEYLITFVEKAKLKEKETSIRNKLLDEGKSKLSLLLFRYKNLKKSVI